jgi:hypothetical protein
MKAPAPGNRGRRSALSDLRCFAQADGTSYSGVTGCEELALRTAWTNPLQFVRRRGRQRLRSRCAAAHATVDLRVGRTRSAARHRAPGWQQQAGAGEQHRRWQRDVQASVWKKRGPTGLYPRHTAARVDSLDDTRVAVSSTPVHGGGIAGTVSAGLEVSAAPLRRGSQRGVGATIRTHGRTSVRLFECGGRQRQGGNGRSDAVRLLARGMLRRVRTALRGTVVTTRRDFAGRSIRLERGLSGPRSRRDEGRAGKRSEPFPHRDATCPEPRAEQTVEVVRIHAGGTRCAAGGAGTPKEGGNTDLEWTHWGYTDEGGNAGEAQERRIRRLVQGESWRTEGDAKSMEDALGVSILQAPGGSGTEKPQGSL